MKSKYNIVNTLNNSYSFPHLTSTSGLLCLSTFWEGKFLRHVAAVRERCTASRYGLRALVVYREMRG
jgi:hypothetical protein